MLVVTRKIGERILIGDKVVVTVVKIGNGGVRLGVDAPPEMAIVREELEEQLRRAEAETLKAATLKATEQQITEQQITEQQITEQQAEMGPQGS